MRIVVADPDVSFLTTAQPYFADRGHEAEIATTGLDCLTLLQEFRPAVLLISSDLLWGGPDGVLDVMQNDPVLGHIHVLLLAGQGISPVLKQHLMVRAIVTKPIRLEDLIRQISRLRSGRHVGPIHQIRLQLLIAYPQEIPLVEPVCRAVSQQEFPWSRN